MKKLSDYKDDEALELWGKLLDPLTKILSDAEFTRGLKNKPMLKMARDILQKYKKEASEILLIIDPTPIDGMNILLRLVALLQDLGTIEEFKVFFESVGQEKSENESSGSATENTEDGVK